MRHRLAADALCMIALTSAAAGVALMRSADAGAADPVVAPRTQPAVRTLPASRGGQDLVGRPMPRLTFDRWLQTDHGRAPDLDHAVVLYRWWTDTCPYCARTLPAIEKLRRAYGPRGLRVVAVYHPKPPGVVPDDRVLAAARRLGFDGAVAVDPKWDALKQAWLSTGDRPATSVSFLVDRDGIIRFVHPGVEYCPSDNPRDAQQDQDYRLIEQDIQALLK